MDEVPPRRNSLLRRVYLVANAKAYALVRLRRKASLIPKPTNQPLAAQRGARQRPAGAQAASSRDAR